MPEGIHNVLTKREIAALRNLSIGSRFTVEGNLQGAHRSPLKGFSIEFSDYRPYVRGDDLRHLDWKVYARNERLYIRQYEEECNLRVYLLVDGSGSMAFSHNGMNKYAYASKLAAAIAYITVQQQDSVGLTIFDRAIRRQLPARSSREHLRLLGDSLTDHEPTNETNVAETLHRLAQDVRRRALVILFSDLLDDLPKVNRALAHFRRRKHDVIVYQILDQAEINFPFHDIGNFEDLETGGYVITNPREVRHAYQEAISDHLYACQRICASLDIDYALGTTEQEATEFLRRHLSQRSRRGR
ncbi:MAG: DUF58 domain-containing protein [Candidatus Pacebacteria bacterium]|nr:DUF58 domain-containing protein [Candidatus Paceibacterota bacterium]